MIHHHPNESTLAAYAAGMLDEGRSLVVATHVEMCSVCRRFTSALEDVGDGERRRRLRQQLHDLPTVVGVALPVLAQPGHGRAIQLGDHPIRLVVRMRMGENRA